MTNMGASAEGAEMTTFLAPPFKWAEAFSVLIIISGYSLIFYGEDARGKDTSRFNNIVRAGGAPGYVRRIFLRVEFDLLSIHNKGILLHLNASFELPMRAVVLEHVCLRHGQTKSLHLGLTSFRLALGSYS